MEKSPLFRKGLVWVWGALCVGFAAGLLVSRFDRAQERAVVLKMHAEFEALKKEALAATQAQSQLAGLKQELAATQDALAAALKEKPSAPAEPTPVPPSPDPKKAFSDMVLRIGQAQLKGQIEGRLGVLKERLALSPEQEAAVKKLLDDEAGQAAAALDRLMAGQGTPSDFGRLARLQRGQLPDGVEAVLADGQKADYAAYKEQERVSSVENRLGLELSGLVTAGGLTPEQKDQAYSTLGEVMMNEDAAAFDTMKDTAEVRQFVDEATQRRIEVMEPILTDSQFQMYRQQVDLGRQVLSQLLPPDPQ